MKRGTKTSAYVKWISEISDHEYGLLVSANHSRRKTRFPDRALDTMKRMYVNATLLGVNDYYLRGLKRVAMAHELTVS